MQGELSEVLGTDLVGHQIIFGYWVEVRHSLMGTFPALYQGTRDIVVTPTEALIQAVLEQLPTRPSSINRLLVLVRPDGKTCYSLEARDKAAGLLMPFLSQEEFDRLVSTEEEPFKWAPGLV